MLIWRKYRVPSEEVEAQRELAAQRSRAMDELRLAAEEYRWTTLNENGDAFGVDR
jgi:hypothetical protein